ncbi:MAG: 2-isopropylmalate synthase [Frankia sp.]
MNRVIVFDTTLRDGEQAPGMTLGVDAKFRIARTLTNLGVDVVEAGFPASAENDAIAVSGIAREYGRDVTVAALCRANTSDIETAARALAPAARRRFHVFVPASDLHIQAKLESDRATVLANARTGIAAAREHSDDVQFGLEDATRADRGYLAELIRAAIDVGATTVAIADTVGYLTPIEMSELVTDLFRRVPALADVVLSVHCHDDLGMAVANSLAGVSAGARQVECTINGIGERAGNAALEEIVMALATRSALFGLGVGVDTTKLCDTSAALARELGLTIPPNKAVVGANAFAHEAGIHQHGVLANPLTYEIMTPESVGAPGTKLVFGQHSGRRALAAMLDQHGIALAGSQLRMLMDDIKDEGATVPVPRVLEMAHARIAADRPVLTAPGRPAAGDSEPGGHVPGDDVPGNLVPGAVR